jgi:hypothetical protein
MALKYEKKATIWRRRDRLHILILKILAYVIEFITTFKQILTYFQTESCTKLNCSAFAFYWRNRLFIIEARECSLVCYLFIFFFSHCNTFQARLSCWMIIPHGCSSSSLLELGFFLLFTILQSWRWNLPPLLYSSEKNNNYNLTF